MLRRSNVALFFVEIACELSNARHFAEWLYSMEAVAPNGDEGRMRICLWHAVHQGDRLSFVAWFSRHRRYRIAAGQGKTDREREKRLIREGRLDNTLEVRSVSLRFGGVRALADVSFAVRDGELFSIIGPNGAGKTSIVNCISGRYRPTEGQLIYRGRDITGLTPNARASLGIGRTFQNLALFHHMSVLDNIMVGRHHLLKNNFITGSLYWLTGARREELEHRRKVEEIIDFLDLQSVRKATAGTLAYGLRKRVELARAMALEPKLILLDEPMAGMNFEEKEDMARYIVDLNEEFGMTVVMIEHDMGVVMDISHRVTVLDFGRKIAEGDPAAVLADPHVKRAYLGEEDEVLIDPDDEPLRESAA
jgi:branched-chain amino acid transport system ATP-binding protein